MYVELQNKTVKTKVPHRCMWCAERIDKGNFAVYRVYVYEGEFDNDWMHPECATAMRDLSAGDSNFTFQPGEFIRGKCHA